MNARRENHTNSASPDRDALDDHRESKMQLTSVGASAIDASSFSLSDIAIGDSTMCLAKFIERKFIPNHVEHLSLAGRTHYQAILKHVLKPETVDLLFRPYVGIQKARLKALPDWPYLDEVRLCDLKPDHVRQLATSAFTRGYSHQTVKHIRNVMSAIVSHATRERMFTGDNPSSEVDLPLVPGKTSHNLTILETKTILRLMQYPEREIALITLTTGMTISEICALQWKHVNLTRSLIYAEGKCLPPRSVIVIRQWDASGLVDVNAKRIRHVIIPEPLIRVLLRLRQRRKADPDCFVVATREEDPVSPTNLRELRLKPIGRKLDMPWLSWQVLKRAHEELLSELRIKLSDDLVSSIDSVGRRHARVPGSNNSQDCRRKTER
jgi:integrase